MPPIKKILVAYDFSEGSRAAVDNALELAKNTGARLLIVHVIDTHIADVYKNVLSRELVAEVEQSLTAELKTLGLSEIPHEISVLPGKPAPVILEKARSKNADLIVAGSHGHSAISRILLGSTSSSLVHNSHTPVLLARQAWKKSLPKILVPIDLTSSSEEALPLAKSLAQIYKAKIQLLHVVEIIPHASYGEFGQLVASQIELERNELRKIGQKNGIVTEPIVMEGKSAHSIVHLCEENPDIRLVVMTTHHRKALEHFLLGSVAETVARYLPTNLITIPVS